MSIVYRVPPKTIHIEARSSVKLQFLSSIQYSEPILSERYHIERETTKKRAIDVSKAYKRDFNLLLMYKILSIILFVQLMKKAIVHQRGLREEHVNLWQSYWYTSLRISDSKAKGVINGHKINSTMYYVLSQVSRSTVDVEKNLAMNEGCYRGHHTL